jgi:hypothetical protein
MLFVSVIITIVWMRSRSPINRANYNRIRSGMTKAEVELILGRPVEGLLPFDMVDVHADESEIRIRPFSNKETHWWRNDIHTIVVYFDDEGRVMGKGYTRSRDASSFYQILDWLGL